MACFYSAPMAWNPTGVDTQAEADKLKQLNADTEALGELKAKRDEQQAILDRQLDQDRTALDGQIALLNLQADLATTTAERKRIALRTLAKEEQEARDIADRDIASDDPERRARGAAAKAQIDAEHPLKVEKANRQNADPFERYQLQLKEQVGDLNQALKGVEVDAISRLGDSFEGAAAKALHLHGVLGDIVGDLLKVAEQRAIFALFGGASGGGGIISQFFGHADGGQITGPGTGRSDSILARLSNGEFVVNASAARANLGLLHAINDNRFPGFADGGLVAGSDIYLPALPNARAVQRGVGHAINVTVNAPGALQPEEIARMTARQIAQALPTAVQTSVAIMTGQLRQAGRPGIPQGAGG